MIAKIDQHKKAILLRKQGYSYSEIARTLLVSQSTLSLWLSHIVLDDKLIKLLALKKKRGQMKGAEKRKMMRKRQENLILNEAVSDIKGLSNQELLLLGVIAYWCEGAKQKENNVSQGVVFSNSDPFLLKLFLKWLREICDITEEDILYNLYIHQTVNTASSLKYWSKVLNIPVDKFGKVIIKKHNVKTLRKNIGDKYHGLIRVSVRKSTTLNRRIAGWVTGINNYL